MSSQASSAAAHATAEAKKGVPIELMKDMAAGDAVGIRVWEISGTKHEAPYTVADGTENQDDVAIGAQTVRYVGIGKVAKAPKSGFIASDSFGPCIPIVLFKDDGAWLGHSFGTFLADDLAKNAELDGAAVAVIRRPLKDRKGVADTIATALGKKFKDVKLYDLKTGGTIGVIVYGPKKTILAYTHDI